MFFFVRAYMHSSQCMRAVTCCLMALTLLCGWLREVAPAQPADASVKGIAGLADLQRSFQDPPDDSRIMMRWWWFGPAISKSELEREMRLMKEGGIGGFEVQPVYPLAFDDAAGGIKSLSFLSDDFIEALRFTSEKAGELGLRFDLTLGSGWPYGGPTVPISQAAGRLRVERVNVAKQAQRIALPGVGAGEKLLAVFARRQDGALDDPRWLCAPLALGRSFPAASNRTRASWHCLGYRLFPGWTAIRHRRGRPDGSSVGRGGPA